MGAKVAGRMGGWMMGMWMGRGVGGELFFLLNHKVLYIFCIIIFIVHMH